MSFGKSNQPQRRRRPRAEAEVDTKKQREEREARLNSPLITTVASIVGVVVMLGVATLAAPYTYGSQLVRYSDWHLAEGKRVVKLGRSERSASERAVLIDFSTIMLPKLDQNPPSINKIADTCRQGRNHKLKAVPPHEAHRAYQMATAYLTCAMSTEVTRLCDASERQRLVDQLMEYKERRQNVLAVETHYANAAKAQENYRAFQREQGIEPAPPRTFPTHKLPEQLDPQMAAQMQHLVRLGYLGPSDFGYMGLYVPREYEPYITVGAARYPHCPDKA